MGNVVYSVQTSVIRTVVHEWSDLLKALRNEKSKKKFKKNL